MNLVKKQLKYILPCNIKHLIFCSGYNYAAVSPKKSSSLDGNGGNTKVNLAPGLIFKNEVDYGGKLKNLTDKYIRTPDSKSCSKMWTDLKTESFKEIKGLNSHNFDGVMMVFLRKQKMYAQAKSFFQHLEEKGVANDATLVNFMIVAAECGDEQTAIKLYRKLNKDLFVIQEMQEFIIQGLVKTNLWSESLEILKQVSVVHPFMWLQCVSAALRNGDFNSAMKLVKEIINSNSVLTHSDCKIWLTSIQCSNSLQGKILLESFLEYLKQNLRFLSKQHATILKDIFTRQFPSKISSVIIQSSGECPECHYKLENPRLTPEEHAQLTETILDQLIEGSTSYQNSNPDELQSFLRFLERAKPYNIVVDALNIGFKDPLQLLSERANAILQVVTALTEQGYRPLVLGRKHIWNWNWNLLTKVEHQAKCFYADNISSDDPLILYCALYGGPSTLLLSNDQMRDHERRLTSKSKELFQNWLHAVQVYYEETNGEIQVSHFKPFPLRAQGNWDKGWHIPYEKKGHYQSDVPFSKQKCHWLCIQRIAQ